MNNRSKQRLFIAVDVPEALAPALQKIHDEELDARWTPPEQYHLTLRFLGDTEPEKTGAIQEALAGIQQDAFVLEPDGMDVFPSRRNPRVLVVKLREAPALRSLHQAVERALAGVGIEPEDRPFNPHLTLARLKGARPQQVRAFLRAHQSLDVGPMEIRAFHLYESTLQPGGALHEILSTYPLRPTT